MADDTPSPPSKGIAKKIAYVIAALAVAYLIASSLRLFNVITVGAVVLCGAVVFFSRWVKKVNDELDQNTNHPGATPSTATKESMIEKWPFLIPAFLILLISIAGILYGVITTFIFPPIGILSFGISVFACQASARILIKAFRRNKYKTDIIV